MRRVLVLAISSAAACSSAPKPDLHQGGSIMLAQCGYTVTTHDGASIPQLGTSMLGSDPTPKLVHVNVAHDGRTDMAILWRTNDEATLATTVQYGVNGATDKEQQGFTFVYDLNSATASGATSIRVHETHLCGLTPDTVYSYRVGGQANGKSAWSPVYSFRTLPDAAKTPDAHVELLAIGDTRGGYSTWGQVLQTALAKGTPDVILFSGDMTTLGPIQDDWDSWFQAADPILANTPMIVAHGNHEVNSVNFFSQFAMPADEQNFAVSLGPIHLSVANDTPANASDLTGAIATTLGTNLAAGNGAPWNMMMNHRSMFSSAAGPHPEDVTAIRAAWESIIDANRVDIVFSGHDHDYERSKPMKNGAVQSDPSQGTVFMTIGAAGADLYPAGTSASTAYSESTYSFALVDVSAHLLTLNAYRNDGSMLDSLMIAK
jgi:hypothetical protein